MHSELELIVYIAVAISESVMSDLHAIALISIPVIATTALAGFEIGFAEQLGVEPSTVNLIVAEGVVVEIVTIWVLG